jgi:hypothetical protein
MSPSTSGAAREQSNHHQKPLRKSAHRNRGIESYRGDYSEDQRALREAVERQQGGLEGLQAARWQLLKLFARVERLGEHIDRAFAGQLFLPDVAPDAPANRRRFKTYVAQLNQRTSNSEEADSDGLSDPKSKRGQVLIEAKLNSSIDTVLHYQTALKRDFYRAIATLRALQRERREKNSANGCGGTR